MAKPFPPYLFRILEKIKSQIRDCPLSNAMKDDRTLQSERAVYCGYFRKRGFFRCRNSKLLSPKLKVFRNLCCARTDNGEFYEAVRGVAKGGGELGARAPGCKLWGRINTLYSAI